MLSRAQSTIEYIILIVIIMVAGLLVVYFATNFFDSGSTIDSGDKVGSKISLGSISIFEVVGDNDNVVMILNSLMEDGVTLTKINVDGVENIFDKRLFSSKKGFVLENLSQNCTCSSEQLFRNCLFEIFYITKEGLSKNESLTIKVECIDNIDIDKNDYYRLKEDEDSEAPSIELLSPSNNDLNKEREIEFKFSASDNVALKSCSLIINGIVEETITSDFSSFTKIFLGEETWDDYEWDINCTDSSDNVASSTNGAFNLSVQTFGGGNGSSESPFEIYNCYQLQDMNNNLTLDFVLMQDIDCSDTLTWNGGLGFKPIGDCSPNYCLDGDEIKFEGKFNGNYNTIQGLKINRPSTNGVGIFAIISEDAELEKIKIVDQNIIGNGHVGGLVGSNEGTINEVLSNGITIGYAAGVGGLVGISSGNINKAVTFGEVRGNSGAGGIIGSAVSYSDSNLLNSYSKASVRNSATSVLHIGGLVGLLNRSNHVSNSYSAGAIYDNGTYNYSGGLVGTANENTTIKNSFSTTIVPICSSDGGLIGSFDPDKDSIDNLENVFWDITLTTRNNCYSINTLTKGSAGCDSTTNQEEYYFDKLNAPLSLWDFDTIWQENSNDYPTLQWENN